MLSAKLTILVALSFSYYTTNGQIGPVDNYNDDNNWEMVEQEMVISKSAADSAWAMLPTFIYKGPITDKIAINIAAETFRRKYFDAGFSFWQRFPNDDRKYIWFQSMVENLPEYWSDVKVGAKESVDSRFYTSPVDVKQLNNFKRHLALLERDFLSSSDILEMDKSVYYSKLLLSELLRSENTEYRGDKTMFITRIRMLFEKSGMLLKEHDNFGSAKRNIEALFIGSNNYGISMPELREFVMYFKNSSSIHLRNWAQKKLALFEFENRPFIFNATTVEGHRIDLEDLKGKVILLDFWNIGCSSCIERMPVIKRFYDMNKSKGFEVISVCMDSEEKLGKAETIKRSIGADWPMIMFGGKNSQERINPNSTGNVFWTKFGFTSVPQLILLNKEGRLVLINGTLLYGRFEPLVEKLLQE